MHLRLRFGTNICNAFSKFKHFLKLNNSLFRFNVLSKIVVDLYLNDLINMSDNIYILMVPYIIITYRLKWTNF